MNSIVIKFGNNLNDKVVYAEVMNEEGQIDCWGTGYGPDTDLNFEQARRMVEVWAQAYVAGFKLHSRLNHITTDHDTWMRMTRPEPAVEKSHEAMLRTWKASGVRLDRYDEEHDFITQMDTSMGDQAARYLYRHNDEICAVWSFGSGHIITEYEDQRGDKSFVAHAKNRELTFEGFDAAAEWLFGYDVWGA